MIFRVLAPLTVVLFSWTAAASVQAQRSTATSFDLDKFVNAQRLALQLPGLAAVVSGERRIGKGDPITPADRMHLGSLTKAITATVIGALAENSG